MINFGVSSDDDSLLNASLGDPSFYRLQHTYDTSWKTGLEKNLQRQNPSLSFLRDFRVRTESSLAAKPDHWVR